MRWLKRKRVEGKSLQICNLKQDAHDRRDFLLAPAFTPELPEKASLRKYAPNIKNQGAVGSCGSHALATAIEIRMAMGKYPMDLPLSERWHYYKVRQPDYMNTFPQDSGQYLRDGLRVAHNLGVSPEVLCPYDWRKYNEAPAWGSDSFARFFKINSYNRCYDLNAIKTAIALGRPVMFGTLVNRSFLLNRDGKIVFPAQINDPKAGGHAMVIDSYNDITESFGVINSWGSNWGRAGYCTIPYKWIEAFLLDAWAVE